MPPIAAWAARGASTGWRCWLIEVFRASSKTLTQRKTASSLRAAWAEPPNRAIEAAPRMNAPDRPANDFRFMLSPHDAASIARATRVTASRVELHRDLDQRPRGPYVGRPEGAPV